MVVGLFHQDERGRGRGRYVTPYFLGLDVLVEDDRFADLYGEESEGVPSLLSNVLLVALLPVLLSESAGLADVLREQLVVAVVVSLNCGEGFSRDVDAGKGRSAVEGSFAFLRLEALAGGGGDAAEVGSL
jgi:hypothetical protein